MFELEGRSSPCFKEGTNIYWKPLDYQLKSYGSRDPGTKPKIAVPVTLPEHVVKNALRGNSDRRKAVADLINIAFYYLLRVGEYTHTSSTMRRRTVQFRIKDITLWRNGKVIPNSAPLRKLLQADEATLRITNQKNGKKNQCINNTCTGTIASPIKSIARRVHNIMQNGGDANTIISLVNDKNGSKSITATTINRAVKRPRSSTSST